MYKCVCVCVNSILRWKGELACIGAWLGSLSATCFIRVVRYNNIIIGRRRIILYNNNIIDPRSRINLKTSRALLSLWSSIVHTTEDISSRYVILFNNILFISFCGGHVPRSQTRNNKGRASVSRFSGFSSERITLLHYYIRI